MRTETHDMTHFVGIFNNRRVPFRVNIVDSIEVKSEDGILA